MHDRAILLTIPDKSAKVVGPNNNKRSCRRDDVNIFKYLSIKDKQNVFHNSLTP